MNHQREAALAAMSPQDRAMVERAEDMAAHMIASATLTHGPLNGEDILNAVGNMLKFSFSTSGLTPDEIMTEFDSWAKYTRENLSESFRGRKQ